MADRVMTTGFVGRSSELAAVERAVTSARAGMPMVLLIGGDAGIGKSTLVAEAAQRSGAALIVGRCVPMGGDTIPFAPLSELLRNVRRTRPGLLAGSPALTPLHDWLSGEIAASSADRSVGGLFGPVLELLATLGDDGVIMVAFEDLHWADAVTWDLIHFLARNVVDERIVLVGTYRANEVATKPSQRRRLGELARLPTVQRIHLKGLGRTEIAAKVDDLIGKPAPAGLIDAVVARGEGNPFFTEELVAAHLAGQAIPEVLSDLVATDLGELDETGRWALGAIATVGHDTDHRLLVRVADLDEGALEAAMRTAIDAQLVVIDRENDSYRFRHALIGEVVYAELLPSERARLHGRIADFLAEQSPHLLARADRAGELAFHLDKAGDTNAAFGALLRAADAAETVAPAAAVRHLERAFELWDSIGDAGVDADRGGRLWQAAELASATVGNERATELAREAFRHGEPARGAAWGHERLGRYLWASGHLDESAVEFEQAAVLLQSSGHEGAPAIAGLAQAELMLGRYDTAERLAQRVLGLVPDALSDPPSWAMARRVLGIVTSHSGAPALGVDYCRQAFAAAPGAQPKALALLYLGVALLDAGRYGDAVNEMLDASADARLTGVDPSFGGYMDSLAAEGLLRLGRWADAEVLLTRHDLAETVPFAGLRLASVGALIAARRGDRNRAHALLAQANALPVDPFHRQFVDYVAADVHLTLGEWARAAAITARALEDGPDVALWRARFVMLDSVAQVESVLDARARRETMDLDSIAVRGRAQVDAVRKAAVENNGGLETADIAAHLADAAATLTRLDDPAPDAWATAVVQWEQLADPYRVAAARLREADAAAMQGAAARASDALQDAHRVASELGAAALLADIDAVSKRTRLSVDAPTRVFLAEAAIDRLGLTAREAEVLSLVAVGRTNRQIGEILYVSEKTASVHVSNILRKLAVTSRVDAAAIAQRLGIA